MTVLVHLVKLSNDIHLCLFQVSFIALGLALLEDEQTFKLGDLLAAMKCQFHTPRCRVYTKNNCFNTLSTNQVP
jgi:predicted rRNA methylase YqxC with S4 and FtsJ domains